jgi:hypothetical protein
MGPVVMVLLGVLALLHTFQLLSFHRSWPLLLIGIGAVMVLQRSAPLDDHVSPNLPPGPPAGPNASEVRNG